MEDLLKKAGLALPSRDATGAPADGSANRTSSGTSNADAEVTKAADANRSLSLGFTPFPVVVPLEALSGPPPGKKKRPTREAALHSGQAGCVEEAVEDEQDDDGLEDAEDTATAAERAAKRAEALLASEASERTSDALLPVFGALELLQPALIEAERVLGVRHVDAKLARRDEPPREEWLVKWAGLPYAEASWEVAGSFLGGARCYASYLADLAAPCVPRPTSAAQRQPDGGAPKPVAASDTFKGGRKLREYQLEGVNWMLSSWSAKKNVMLADEMGLGKTAQIVATIAQLARAHGVSGPFLIVAPLSTIGHWARELGAWSDLRALTYHGSAEDRAVIAKYQWHAQKLPERGRQRRALAGRRRGGGGGGGGGAAACGFWFEVAVTTYETLLLEEPAARRAMVDAGLRRGAPSQEPRESHAHGGRRSALRARGAAHRHARAEQRVRALLAAQSPRPSQVPRRRGLRGALRLAASLRRRGLRRPQPAPRAVHAAPAEVRRAQGRDAGEAGDRAPVELSARQKELYRALLSQNALALAHAQQQQQQQQQVGEASANGAARVRLASALLAAASRPRSPTSSSSCASCATTPTSWRRTIHRCPS